jgi:pilus assembly protein Flp/PilA
VAEFGHKTGDLIGVAAAILPGAHLDDNAPIVSGKLIETKAGGADGKALNGDNGAGGVAAISLDVAGIAAAKGTDRLGNNLQGAAANGAETSAAHIGTVLVLEPK